LLIQTENFIMRQQYKFDHFLYASRQRTDFRQLSHIKAVSCRCCRTARPIGDHAWACQYYWPSPSSPKPNQPTPLSGMHLTR